MFRKRTRSVQKEAGESGILGSGSESNTETRAQGTHQMSNSFFNVASLFWGLNPMSASYNDSAKSPKSPLDEVFLTSPGSPQHDLVLKSWSSSKVGLGIVDSLDADDGRNIFSRDRIVLSLDNKAVGPKMGAEPLNSEADDKPLPRNSSFPHACVKSPACKSGSGVVFEIGSALLDSNHDSRLIRGSLEPDHLSFSTVASKDGFVGSLSANEIELSEDYTRVTMHGPNPKTTHIYGDCILECEVSSESLPDFVKKSELDMQANSKAQALAPSYYPFVNFLSSCYTCKKSLDEGKDIYIYGGEKAFCSTECRLEEISSDKETEGTTAGSYNKGVISEQAL